MESKPKPKQSRKSHKQFDEKFTLRLTAAHRQALARRAGGKRKVAAFVRGWIEGLARDDGVSAA